MPVQRWVFLFVVLWTGFGPPVLRAAPASVARAGSPFTIDGWGPQQKFPGSSVIAMAQTQDGYLWLGTLYGLVRFDGVKFQVFDESNTPELGSVRIVSLFEDREGNLWIGTETAGVMLVKDGKFVKPGIGEGGPAGRLMSVCQDAAGAVWLCTADGQLWRYREGKVETWGQGTNAPSQYREVIAEKSGRLWVAMDRQIFSFDPAKAEGGRPLPREHGESGNPAGLLLASAQGGRWQGAAGRIEKRTAGRREPEVVLKWPSVNLRVGAACEDREGNLILGTLGTGLWWFDASGKAVNISTKNGLANDFVLSLLMDQEGSLWVGTDGGGLNRVRRQVFEAVEQTRGWVVQSVCEDAEGGIWIGSNGRDAALWKNGSFTNLPVGWVHESVRSVLVDRAGNVWAGTLRAGLFQLLDGRFSQVIAPLHPDVTSIHEDRGGRLWVGTYGGLAQWHQAEWQLPGATNDLSSEIVQALASDAETNLWVGTVGGGLNRLRDGRFTAFRKSEGCPSDDISALFVDGEGVLWVGTFGSGLGRFQQGRWTRYTTREGLVSNSIAFIIDDEQDHLWLGSNLGLMRVPKKALNEIAKGTTALIPCRVYGETDGLPSSECSLGTACRARDGRLWFPTISGLASVFPSSLKPNPRAPPVIIESVLLDGEEAHSIGLRARLPESVTIPAGKERLEIRYTGLSLGSPDQVRIRYRLEGHESAWTEMGDSRVARYSKLPPGNYVFRVTACNEDGVWSQSGSVLAFIVTPPIWKTWWFLSGTAVCLLAALVGFVHYMATQKLQRQLEGMRQKEALERDRARIARDLHDQLGASMTQVSLLAEMAESDKDVPEEVEAHAKQITQTARETTRVLDEIVWAVNPSNDTLDSLVTYVVKYAQDYFAVVGVRYRIDVPGELPSDPIAPEVRHNVFLAFKEAVTNVVRHAGAASAWIRLKLEAPGFTLEIEDDGRGLAGIDERKGRNGLRNMRSRMEDVGGSFSIRPGPERGAIVRLTAPLPKR